MLNTKAAARIDLLQLEQWMLVRLTECKALGDNSAGANNILQMCCIMKKGQVHSIWPPVSHCMPLTNTNTRERRLRDIR